MLWDKLVTMVECVLFFGLYWVYVGMVMYGAKVRTPPHPCPPPCVRTPPPPPPRCVRMRQPLSRPRCARIRQACNICFLSPQPREIGPHSTHPVHGPSSQPRCPCTTLLRCLRCSRPTGPSGTPNRLPRKVRKPNTAAALCPALPCPALRSALSYPCPPDDCARTPNPRTNTPPYEHHPQSKQTTQTDRPSQHTPQPATPHSPAPYAPRVGPCSEEGGGQPIVGSGAERRSPRRHGQRPPATLGTWAPNYHHRTAPGQLTCARRSMAAGARPGTHLSAEGGRAQRPL